MRNRVVCGVALALSAVLAILQIASASIFSTAGTAASLPAHIPRAFGVRVYEGIERIAPFSFVESMLARAALDRGDLVVAQAHVDRMTSPSVERDELQARIALARGDRGAAIQHFLAAVDINALDAEVDRLRRADKISEAYHLENATRDRLARGATHPDAVAESYWRSGVLATTLGYENPRNRRRWFLAGLDDYRHAIALAPLSEKFILAAGFQNINLMEYDAARTYFARSIDIDPVSAPAYAGLATVALRQGDRALAATYAARSRALDPDLPMLAQLERELR